jgi:Spy/CpxP family protein refolding chaperone
MISRCRAAAALLGAALVLAFAAAAAEAQELVRVVGMVQWVAGTKMQVMTERGASVAIDLTQADQASYQALRTGEAVVVDGVLSTDRRRVVAHEIWRDSGQGSWIQSP